MGATADEPAPSRKHGFMRSTWHQKPQSEYSFAEKMLERMQPNDQPAPPIRTGKLPVMRVQDQWLYLTARGLIPILLQVASQLLLGLNWHPAFALLVYMVGYGFASISTTKMAHSLAQKWGVMNASVARDKVPDVKVDHLSLVFRQSAVIRNLSAVLLLYDQREHVTISLWFPVKAALFALLIDLFFYIYHRLTHEVDWLWNIHKTHHMTKAPTPVLVILADAEQEFLEIFLIPLTAAFLTSQLVPFSFHEWFLASCGVISTEIFGHSGIRAHIEGHLTAPFLRPFGLELCLEDHDIHHRHGWKNKGHNYGKQSRVWDYVFGTMGDRGEARADNIDWSLSVFDPVPKSS